MDDSSSSALLAVLLLVLAQAVITLAYAAIFNARRSQMEELADVGSKRAKDVLLLIEGRPRLQLTYKLYSSVLLFSVAAVAVAGVALPLADNFPGLPQPLILLLAGGLALLAAMVLGDIVPEAIGGVYADTLAPWMVGAVRLLLLLAGPAVLLLLAVSRLISRLFGSSRMIDVVTEEEIMTLVSAGHTGGSIEAEEKEMIYSVLQLDETVARELMVPRIDVVALEISATIREAVDIITQSGFSRVPVYEDNIDNITGLIYAKDLLKLLQNGQVDLDRSLHDLVRPAYFVPETKRADALLRELKSREVHLAIVVDEYGGTSGLVTIEDLIEEIIGDIRDEYDQHEEDEYVLDSSGNYVVDGGMDLDDFNDLLEVELDSEEADTLGGYIFAILGRMPQADEVIETEELILHIREIEGRRIRKVEVTRKRDDGELDKTRSGSAADQDGPPT